MRTRTRKWARAGAVSTRARARTLRCHRLVSLSFRLYGNVFGGENLINNIMALAPWTKYLLPVPFYFLEILIGVVQALVFTLLVAVYIGSICNHGDEETTEGTLKV